MFGKKSVPIWFHVSGFALLTFVMVGCGDAGGRTLIGRPNDTMNPDVETVIGEDSVPPEPETNVLEVSGVLFPKHEFGEIPADMITGTLSVDGSGCLRLVTSEADPGSTVIWPPDYSLLSREGEFRVLDGAERVAALVGDAVSGGGGYIGSSLEGISGVDDKIRHETMDRCPGEYFYAGDVRRNEG